MTWRNVRRDEKFNQNNNRTKKINLRDLNADTRTTFKVIRRGNKCKGVNWIQLAQDRI
jgi:hypothetical protein